MSAVSPVSVDSSGWPRMLQGSPSGLEESPVLSRTGSSSDSARGSKQSQGQGRSKKIVESPGMQNGLNKKQKSAQRGISSLPLLSKKVQGHQKNLDMEAAAAMECVAGKSVPKTKSGGNKKKAAKRPAAHLEAGALGVQKKPAAKTPAAEGLATKPAAAEKLEKKPEVRYFGWEKHKAEKYSRQSYIRGYWSGKWHLLVACNENQAAFYLGGHHAVIDASEPYCHKPGMTKQKLLEQRAVLLKNSEA